MFRRLFLGICFGLLFGTCSNEVALAQGPPVTVSGTPPTAMNEAAANLSGMSAYGTHTGTRKLELTTWWIQNGTAISIYNQQTFSTGTFDLKTHFGTQNGQIPFEVGRKIHWSLWWEVSPGNWTNLGMGTTTLQ